MRPIISKPGKTLTKRVILVDQFGDKHRTEPIQFLPTKNDTARFLTGTAQINCLFCGQPIAAEELSESSHVPAHKKCIK